MLYTILMTAYDVIFIINFALLFGFTVYYCHKKQLKQMACNIVVLALFVLAKFVEVYYVNIRTQLYEMLGERAFNILRDFISASLFFGTSITVGVQFVTQIFNFLLLLVFAAKAIKFLKKCPKKVFSATVSSENEKIADKCKKTFARNYLIYERLLN